MKFYMYIIFTVVLLQACKVEKDENNSNFEKAKEENSSNVEISLYPTGSPGSPRYSIAVKDQYIIFNAAILYEKTDVKSYKSKLTKEQVEELERLVLRVKNKVISPRLSMSEDTWGMAMLVDNVLVFNAGDFSLEGNESPPDVKELYSYIIDLLPFEIFLYGFA